MSDLKEFNSEQLEVWGAKVHNLQNVDVKVPRNSLVVVTGLSGSGKSSLAFDTIYAEGQRRYMETLSAYARQFIGNMERPDVDKINGLSPVISIEQKTTSRSPRSTVGTVTEIYDFLRLLYARAGTAYSYETGEEMVQYTDEQILKLLLDSTSGAKIQLLAPLVRSRKGHYRDLFEQVARQGYLRVRVDGEMREITRGMKLDRYKTHDIELVIDRLVVAGDIDERLRKSLETAMFFGKGVVMILIDGQENPRYFSRHLMCPTTGISYPEPEPNTFSFNSPKGACNHCNGLGKVSEVDLNKIIPDPKVSIRNGGLAPLGTFKRSWIFNQLEIIGDRYNFNLDMPVGEIPEEGMEVILYGAQEAFEVENKNLGVTRKYSLQFEGIIRFIEDQAKEAKSIKIKRWAEDFMNKVVCPVCEGSRLKKEARHFRIANKNIAEVTAFSITHFYEWLVDAESQLTGNNAVIAKEVFKELKARTQFLLNVGLGYLSLNRSAKTLSGGEAQRIRLATQIGSKLTNVLYILDEPSIGLHQRDNQKLIGSLEGTPRPWNSVMVVEHDKDMMESADFILDIGPGAGKHGGQIVNTGKLDDILKGVGTTADYLSGRKEIAVPKERRKGNGKTLQLKGAQGHNLKEVNLSIPLGKLVVVTGVSGSGKSTLINETLYPILNHHFFRAVKKPLAYDSIKGLKNIDKVIDIDQSPIGRTPRSNPATYTGVLSDIRTLFSQLPRRRSEL